MGFYFQLQGNFGFCSALQDLPAVPQPVAETLKAYGDIFQEPTSLPPSRIHDHSFTLHEGVQPISVQPYRYPFYQKEEIEKIIQELLHAI
jgi:hypothetical protein